MHSQAILLVIYCFICLAQQIVTESENDWLNERVTSEEERRVLKVSSFPTQQETNMLRGLTPLKEQNDYIVFWRPQKVGSSTLLSILMSYAYRYNTINKRKASPNSFCRLIAQCALERDDNLTASAKERLSLYSLQKVPGNSNMEPKTTETIKKVEAASLSIPYHIVATHELCALENEYIQSQLLCSFQKGATTPSSQKSNPLQSVKQLFLVREPLSRAISIYYFWGELSKLVLSLKSPDRTRRLANEKKKKKGKAKLGSTNTNLTVEKGMFRYHGVETVVPPLEYALDFAHKFPYRAGMPGPSFTWSAFSKNIDDAIEHINSDRMLTLVLDRLDESLVVAVHYLNWSIADAVVAMQRKSLSNHPKYPAWPNASIDILKAKLERNGEFRVYEASRQQLDRKIERLKREGIDIDSEVKLLKQLRKRVSKVSSFHIFSIYVL